MFGRANVVATVTSFSVRGKDGREQDPNSTIEVGFSVPLTFELADEVLPSMARGLYQKVGKDWVPKPDMTSSTWEIELNPQVLAVALHPEMEPEARIDNVKVRKTVARKISGGQWALSFTVMWTLVGTEYTPFVTRYKKSVYLTMEPMQKDLLAEQAAAAAPAPEEGATATVDGEGTVVSIQRGRRGGRGRKRQTPEDIAREQLKGNGAGSQGGAGNDDTDHDDGGGGQVETHTH